VPYCPFHKGLSVCVAALLFKKQRHSLICAALASSADPLRVSANSVLLLWHKPFCICHAASVWSLCQKTLASVTQPQCCHSDTNPFASVMQPQCGHFAKKPLHLSRSLSVVTLTQTLLHLSCSLSVVTLPKNPCICHAGRHCCRGRTAILG